MTPIGRDDPPGNVEIEAWFAARRTRRRRILRSVGAGVAACLVLGVIIAIHADDAPSANSKPKPFLVGYRPSFGWYDLEWREHSGPTHAYCLRYDRADEGIECAVVAGQSSIRYTKPANALETTGDRASATATGARAPTLEIATYQYPHQNLESHRKALVAASSGNATVTKSEIRARPALALTDGSTQTVLWLARRDVIVKVTATDADLGPDELSALVDTLQPRYEASPTLIPIWATGVAPKGALANGPAASYDVDAGCVVASEMTRCVFFPGRGPLRLAGDMPTDAAHLALARTDPEIARVRVEFEGGTSVTVRPTHFPGFGDEGYVAVRGDGKVRSVTGLAAGGSVVTRVHPAPARSNRSLTAAATREQGSQFRYEFPAAPAGYTVDDAGTADVRGGLCLRYRRTDGDFACRAAAGQSMIRYVQVTPPADGSDAGAIELWTLQYPDQTAATLRKYASPTDSIYDHWTQVGIGGRPALTEDDVYLRRYWLASDNTVVLANGFHGSITPAEFDALIATARPVKVDDNPKRLPIWRDGIANRYEDPDFTYDVDLKCAVDGYSHSCQTFSESGAVSWSGDIGGNLVVRTDSKVVKVRVETQDGDSYTVIPSRLKAAGGTGYFSTSHAETNPVWAVIGFDAKGKEVGREEVG